MCVCVCVSKARQAMYVVTLSLSLLSRFLRAGKERKGQGQVRIRLSLNVVEMAIVFKDVHPSHSHFVAKKERKGIHVTGGYSLHVELQLRLSRGRDGQEEWACCCWAHEERGVCFHVLCMCL